MTTKISLPNPVHPLSPARTRLASPSTPARVSARLAKENVDPSSTMDSVSKTLPRSRRDGSESDSSTSASTAATARTRKQQTTHNGLPVLSTVPDDDAVFPDGHAIINPPPPARSAATGTEQRPVTRPRRSSSIKRKPSPGVVPQKAVDWEIPRKSLHSSIGFLTLALNYLEPPTLKPLIQVLSILLVSVLTTDVLRLRFPSFAAVWEEYFGALMRESERDQVNGVVYYLVGVIFVLSFYPRDVAVVAILTLSWSDTTASTIGRLWGRYTAPLPAHVPGIKFLPFAPRKSLAGFLAATVTGFMIGIGFWWNGSPNHWTILEGAGKWGVVGTAVVVGVGGAIVEALDLGLDDNLTLPILSGAVVWLWLSATNLIF
ncbi:hypothetical protein P7C73_g3716, partial [Tremellales sp. Uapishka_1]